jgi:hypothetical protein
MRRRAAAGAVLGLIAAAYAVLIFRNVSYAAGGPDESGYMNEARMLRAGRAELAVFPLRTMRLDRSFIDVFNPLGFVPTARGTIVPAYPPGYPIHLMLASFLGGWERAPFYVAPLAAIGAILLMFGVARELGLPFGHAVGAAAILAVFPTFAEQSLQVMSDVPATFWALMTIWLALRRNPVAAGMAFGVAVWVRPTNLLLFVPLAIILGRHIVRAIAGALPFGVLLLIFNATLYGNPFRTGYGSVTENLSFSAPCLATQTLWLAKLLTPLVLPGGLLVSFDRRVELRQRILLPAWFAVFLLFYALWAVCDAWWCTCGKRRRSRWSSLRSSSSSAGARGRGTTSSASTTTRSSTRARSPSRSGRCRATRSSSAACSAAHS